MVKQLEGVAEASHSKIGGYGNSDVWESIAADARPMPKEISKAPSSQIYNADVPDNRKFIEPVACADVTPETVLSAVELAEDAKKSLAVILAEEAMLDAGIPIATIDGATKAAWRQQNEAEDRLGLRISAMNPDELHPTLAAANEILEGQSYRFVINRNGYVELVEGNKSIWGGLGKPGVPFVAGLNT